jgi:hypothetical protein
MFREGGRPIPLRGLVAPAPKLITTAPVGLELMFGFAAVAQKLGSGTCPVWYD